LASASAVKRAAFAAFGVAAVAGLVLAATTSWWLLVVIVCARTLVGSTLTIRLSGGVPVRCCPSPVCWLLSFACLH
jgi:hypothetical protein